MIKKSLSVLAALSFSLSLCAGEARAIKGSVWDAFLYGIETQQQENEIRLLGKKKKVRLALVSESGLYETALRPLLAKYNATLVYRNGSASTVRSTHDYRQIQSVMELAALFGISLEIHVWQPGGKLDTLGCFAAAGKDADVVLNYNSYWIPSLSRQIANAMEKNPGALYIMPYGEVGKPTGDAPQAFARKFDGSGVPNLLTAIPLAPTGKGGVLHPSNRDARDTQCIDFIVPSAYAHSPGETCPAAGSLTALACFAVAASDTKRSGSEIAELLCQCTWIPEKRMNRLSNFRGGGVEKFKEEIETLTKTDNRGLRRLYAPGLPDILKLRERLTRCQ